NPKLHYRPHPKISLEVGIYANKNFGNSGFDTLMPTLSLQVKERNWNFIFGNLEGSYSHKLVEPLFDFEKGIVNPIEQGIQVKYNNGASYLDTWVDWQRNTKPGKYSQEHISGGLSCLHKPLTLGAISFTFPLQVMVYHYGGQNIPISLPVRTLFNAAVGGNLSLQLATQQKIIIENYLLGYAEDSIKGSAYMLNVRYQSRRFQCILTYWAANKFDAPLGGDLYQSSSRKLGSNVYARQRSLAILRLIYSTDISENMSCSIRIEPFYDFSIGKIEQSTGIYFIYRVPKLGFL
ncbi:MAG TPA: hypothetical protein VL947_09705, partial [Cytophagales bacterium]|nr:hypothetical protein [Cytophagales bacterium]